MQMTRWLSMDGQLQIGLAHILMMPCWPGRTICGTPRMLGKSPWISLIAHLAILAFNGVGGVDNAADLFRIVEEGCQAFPVVLPGVGGYYPLGSRFNASPRSQNILQWSSASSSSSGLSPPSIT